MNGVGGHLPGGHHLHRMRAREDHRNEFVEGLVSFTLLGGVAGTYQSFTDPVLSSNPSAAYSNAMYMSALFGLAWIGVEDGNRVPLQTRVTATAALVASTYLINNLGLAILNSVS